MPAPQCVLGEQRFIGGRCEQCTQRCTAGFQLCGRCTETADTQCVDNNQVITTPICSSGGGIDNSNAGRSTTTGDGNAARHSGWWVVIAAVVAVLVVGMLLARSRWLRSTQHHELELAEFADRLGGRRTAVADPSLVSNPMFAAPHHGPAAMVPRRRVLHRPELELGADNVIGFGSAFFDDVPTVRQPAATLAGQEHITATNSWPAKPGTGELCASGHRPGRPEEGVTAGYGASKAVDGCYEVPVTYIRIASGVDAALYDVPVEAFGSTGQQHREVDAALYDVSVEAFGSTGQQHYAQSAEGSAYAAPIQLVGPGQSAIAGAVGTTEERSGGPCVYRSALDGLSCRNPAIAGSPHCHRHTCTVSACITPKSSHVPYCDEHIEAMA